LIAIAQSNWFDLVQCISTDDRLLIGEQHQLCSITVKRRQKGIQMASKLVIVMANTDPRNGEELGAPIFQASVAAAMEYEVQVICTATSGVLMKKGVAEKLRVKEGSPKTVYDFIKDAHEAGAKFYCCSPNLDLFDMTKDDLIPECSGIVGGAHLIETIMEDDEVRVLTY
jgi:predicted peroxiredoxin